MKYTQKRFGYYVTEDESEQRDVPFKDIIIFAVVTTIVVFILTELLNLFSMFIMWAFF